MRLTAQNLVKAITKLPKQRWFDYISERSGTRVRVVSVAQPEGPITIARYNPNKGEKQSAAIEATISSAMLWRVANAFEEGIPVNFDRVLGASYNTRSALDSVVTRSNNFAMITRAKLFSLSSWPIQLFTDTTSAITHGRSWSLIYRGVRATGAA